MELRPSLDFQSCYRAVTARDARFDGLFFTAVKTTGIYCRSVCPARTPKESSCQFFDTAAAAERAGFRPCLRCRPELAPGRPDFAAGLAQAILRRLEAGALDHGSVETLARGIGLSSRQLRRILLDHFGVTPIEVAQTQRLLFAKKLLHETGLSMVQVALASGFQSLRRFNAIFKLRYGLTPSMLRRQIGGTALNEEEIRLRLSYRAPFAWSAMLEYLRGRATPGIEHVDASSYSRTVDLGSSEAPQRGWLRVRQIPNAHHIEVELPGTLASALMPITHRLRGLFDLDAEPQRIAQHLGVDVVLRARLLSVPGLRVLGAWDPFELAVRAVLGQQVSVAGATTLAGRLAERFGDAITTPIPSLDRLAPQAQILASTPVEAIAGIGLPKARARTLQGLARFTVDGGFERTNRGATLDDVVLALSSVEGIGAWTAHYVAMRALRHPDAFPAGDLGLRKAVASLDGDILPVTQRALEARAEQWRPWRAYAAAYLWNSLRKVPEK